MSKRDVKTYLRKLSSDVWHWHVRCQHVVRWRGLGMPTIVQFVSAKRPKTGELCNECQAKDRDDRALDELDRT